MQARRARIPCPPGRPAGVAPRPAPRPTSRRPGTPAPCRAPRRHAPPTSRHCPAVGRGSTPPAGPGARRPAPFAIRRARW